MIFFFFVANFYAVKIQLIASEERRQEEEGVRSQHLGRSRRLINAKVRLINTN